VKEVAPAEKNKLSFKEKQEFEKLQPEIQDLEKAKVDLTKQLNSGITDHQQLQKLAEEIRKLDETIDAKTLRWLELSELNG
jgi:ATP-binding cassette subfamily F protein uup